MYASTDHNRRILSINLCPQERIEELFYEYEYSEDEKENSGTVQEV